MGWPCMEVKYPNECGIKMETLEKRILGRPKHLWIDKVKKILEEIGIQDEKIEV